MKRPSTRRWRRWLLILAAVAVAGRIALALLLPWLLDLAAGSVGLTATCRSVSLSLLSLSVRLQGLVVCNAHGGAVLVSAQDVSADLSTWQLLRGELVVVDAALAGCVVDLTRAADGTFLLPPELLGGGAAAPAPAPAAAPAPDGTSFVLPFCILRARVHDLRVRCREEAPPQRTTDLVVDVDLVDLGHRERPCRLDVRAHSPQLGERLHIAVRSPATTADRFAVTLQITARGITTDPSAPADKPRADLDLAADFTADRDSTHTREFRLAANLRAAVGIDGRERLALQGTYGPSVPTEHGLDTPFAAAIHAPELVEQLELADGRVELTAQGIDVGARLLCRGLTLASLRPWLAERGITVAAPGLDADATFRATLPRLPDGSLAARLEGVSLRCGEQRCGLASLAIDGVRTTATHLEVGSITADGPVVAVQRFADGGLGVAGLQFRAANGTAPAAPPPPSPASHESPTVRLGKLDWHGANLQFTDEALPAPATLGVQDLTIAGSDLALEAGLPKGHVTATLRADGAIRSVRAELRAQPVPGRAAASADLQFEVLGIQGSGPAPWLQPLGIAAALQDGRLSLSANATIGNDAAATTIDAWLADLRLEDGGETLMSLRRAEVAGMRRTPDTFELGTFRIDEPVLSMQTDAGGVHTVCGVRLLPAAPAAAPAATAPPAPGPAAPPGSAVQLTGLTLAGATLRWQGGERKVAVGLDASVGALRGDGTPGAFSATLRVEQAIEALELRGKITAGPGNTQVAAELLGRGIHGAQLATLLPATISSPLVDGALRGTLDVALRRVERGHSLEVTLTGMALTDGTTELLGIDELALHAPELGAQRLHVAELRLRGVRAVAAQTAQGLQVPGFLLHPSPAVAAAPAAPVASATTDPVAAAASPWPELRLDKLDLQCEQLQFRDRRSEDAEPLAVSVRVQLEQPWATAAELTQTDPVRLLVQVSAMPLCRQMTARATLQPFSLIPRLDLALDAEGIDPTALSRIVPSTGAQLGGTTADVVLTAKVHAELDLHRRDARRFDFSRPFGGRLVVEPLTLRTADGTTLLAVESLDVGARAIDPRRGDVLLSFVDVDEPVLAARRTAQGLQVAGFVLPPPAAAPATAATAQATGPAPELAIDRLRVQGLAFDFRDDTTSPATHLPVQDLDLQVQRFSTRVLSEPRSFSFDLRARGGDVQLDRRIVHGSVVGGILGSAGEMVTGGGDEQESRPLVDDLAVTGELQLFPLAKGHLRASVAAFELPALRGLARGADVVIEDGLFDANVNLLMQGNSGSQARSHLTFTWLGLTEPPGGPISTYLKLPASLDTVLFLLRNEADEQRLQLQMHAPASGAPASAIAEAAVEALALAIGDAVAHSPMRLLRGLQGTVGLGGQDKIAPAVLRCAPGVTQPDPAPLAALLAAIADDPGCTLVLTHDLGAADVEYAARLANPSPATVQASIVNLQRRYVALDREREPIAAETAAAYAAGHVQDALVRHRDLRAVDTRIGELQATLDEALEMLTATGPRTVARRTRQAAAAIGDARLEVVRNVLIERLGPAAARRIEVRRARGVPTAGVAEGGAVVVTVRR